MGTVVANDNTPVCQICHRPRHTAINYYHRMNQAYEGRVPTQKLSVMAAISQSSPSAPHTNTATTWVTYTGASIHITVDLANLVVHEDYHGKYQVVVGNGTGLQIAHIGSSSISHDSSSFKLNNILHCPNVSTSLLCVHQFTHDNNCLFVFFHDCFYVKDLESGKTLFRGKSENGFYPLAIHNQISNKSGRPFAFLGVCVSAQVWHS
ncbi:hypothetical protein ACHQM5_002330 [Ranunculus cassubicifolius]